jgi:phosphomannomutase
MAFLKKTPVEGEQRTVQPRPGVVETVVKGRLTAKLVEAAGAEVERLGAGPIWVFDAVATTGFDTDAVRAGSSLLGKLKGKGLKRVVAILPSATMRMAARAAAVASGMDIRLVENRLEVAPLLVL